MLPQEALWTDEQEYTKTRVMFENAVATLPKMFASDKHSAIVLLGKVKEVYTLYHKLMALGSQDDSLDSVLSRARTTLILAFRATLTSLKGLAGSPACAQT